MSGWTTCDKNDRYFRIELNSIRIEFVDPDDSIGWAEDNYRTYQQIIDKQLIPGIKMALEHLMSNYAAEIRIVPYATSHQSIFDHDLAHYGHDRYRDTEGYLSYCFVLPYDLLNIIAPHSDLDTGHLTVSLESLPDEKFLDFMKTTLTYSILPRTLEHLNSGVARWPMPGEHVNIKDHEPDTQTTDVPEDTGWIFPEDMPETGSPFVKPHAPHQHTREELTSIEITSNLTADTVVVTGTGPMAKVRYTSAPLTRLGPGPKGIALNDWISHCYRSWISGPSRIINLGLMDLQWKYSDAFETIDYSEDLPLIGGGDMDAEAGGLDGPCRHCFRYEITALYPMVAEVELAFNRLPDATVIDELYREVSDFFGTNFYWIPADLANTIYAIDHGLMLKLDTDQDHYAGYNIQDQKVVYRSVDDPEAALAQERVQLEACRDSAISFLPEMGRALRDAVPDMPEPGGFTVNPEATRDQLIEASPGDLMLKIANIYVQDKGTMSIYMALKTSPAPEVENAIKELATTHASEFLKKMPPWDGKPEPDAPSGPIDELGFPDDLLGLGDDMPQLRDDSLLSDPPQDGVDDPFS